MMMVVVMLRWWRYDHDTERGTDGKEKGTDTWKSLGGWRNNYLDGQRKETTTYAMLIARGNGD